MLDQNHLRRIRKIAKRDYYLHCHQSFRFSIHMLDQNHLRRIRKIAKRDYYLHCHQPFRFSIHTLDKNHLRRIRKITKRDYYLRHVCQPSVCPSAWNNPASNVRNFMTFNIWVFLESLTKKFKFIKITGTFHEDMYSWYLTQFFLEWEMFQTKFAKKIETRFLFNKYFPKTMTCMR